MRKKYLSIFAILGISIILNAKEGYIEKLKNTSILRDQNIKIYLGIDGGYIQDNSKIDTNLINSSNGSSNTINFDSFKAKPKGFIGGAFVGFNKKLNNNWLFGVELAFNYNNIKKSKRLTISNTVSNYTFTLKQKSEVALYGKYGKFFGLNNRNIIYLLGGITLTQLEGKLNVLGNSLKDNDSVTGWTLGAGYEYKINKNWNLGIQYRFSKYEDGKFKYIIINPTGNKIFNIKAKEYKTHSIQGKIIFNFN